MAYAEASGLPAINGLYATIAALVVSAIFGPSRSLILGPDYSLVVIVAAISQKRGASLRFAELKGTVRDGLGRFGLVETIWPDRFYRTIEQAVEAFEIEAT